MHYVYSAYASLNDYTYTELINYIKLTGIQLDDWEIQAIMELSKYRHNINHG